MIPGLSTQKENKVTAPTFDLATVGAVYSDGLSLILTAARRQAKSITNATRRFRSRRATA